MTIVNYDTPPFQMRVSINTQKTQSLKQWNAFLFSFLQDAVIKVHPTNVPFYIILTKIVFTHLAVICCFGLQSSAYYVTSLLQDCDSLSYKNVTPSCFPSLIPLLLNFLAEPACCNLQSL